MLTKISKKINALIPLNDKGMIFQWVVGIAVVMYILSQTVLIQLRNEMIVANLVQRAEVVNNVCDSLIEEAYMEIRAEMNDHKKVQDPESAYRVLRCGWQNTKPLQIKVRTPKTVSLAKKYYLMKELGVTVTYEQITPFKKDIMGNDRKVMPEKESYGVLKIIAHATLDSYTKMVTACKDIKVVKILPPFPDFSFFVRNGGSEQSSYNRWSAYQGGDCLNLKILSGLNATKTGKILFGGGYMPKSNEQLLGFKPMPSLSDIQPGQQRPIIINLTNLSTLNFDSGVALDELKEKNFKLPAGLDLKFDFARMFPSFDFWGRAQYGTDVTKESLAARLIEPSLKAEIPLPPVAKIVVQPPAAPSGGTSGSGSSTPATTQVELEHFWRMLGTGFEMGIDGEDNSLHEKGPGFLAYFDEYIKYCEKTKRDYIHPFKSGVDLFGSDMRQGKDSRPQITHVYGNVFTGYLEAYVLRLNKDALIMPWVDFGEKDFNSQKACIPSKLYTEKVDKKVLKGLLDERFKFMPQLGTFKKSERKSIPAPATLGEAPQLCDLKTGAPSGSGPDTANIAYKYLMSRPKFGSYDVSEGPEVPTIIDTVPYNNDNIRVDEIASKFPLDLAPEMACYSFANAKDFIYNLYYMKKLVPPEESKDKQWHMYLDGIWYVEGMKAFEPQFQQLRLPPDAPTGKPLYINGKGIIASIFGTDVMVNGIMKDENTDDDSTQLSVITAPNPLYEKISKLPADIRESIFSSQMGDIYITDTYVQASICAGIGTLRYVDNPKVEFSTAFGVYPFHGPDSAKKDRQGTFDSFFIRGNLIVNYLDLEKLEAPDPKNKNKTIGGGTVAYDEKLFPDKTGKGEVDQNYIVNMSQSYTYYKIEVVKDDQPEKEG